MSEKLHVLLRRARLQWAEQVDGDDSDWALEQAIGEARVIIAAVQAIQQTRTTKGGGA